jgi:hypothetical protein
MKDIPRHIDRGSQVVIAVTFVLFVAALYAKGLGHELLLEAGVFLVSVKLIVMAYKSSRLAEELKERLDRIEGLIRRQER